MITIEINKKCGNRDAYKCNFWTFWNYSRNAYSVVHRVHTSGLKICCTGAIFFSDCPVERFIPIYLIVGGAFAFWGFVSALVQSGCNLADPHHDHHAAFSHFCRVTESLVAFFTLAWFIAGNLSSICLSLCLYVRVCVYCVVVLYTSLFTKIVAPKEKKKKKYVHTKIYNKQERKQK